MSTIRVTTTVEVTDNLGKTVTSLTQVKDQIVTDNGRYWNTHTRGLIQATEHAISHMLVAEYGDIPV